MFTANVGSIDRIIRIVAGLVLLAGFFFLGGTLGIILGVLGLVFLVTGLIGWCPLYQLFHLSTGQARKSS